MTATARGRGRLKAGLALAISMQVEIWSDIVCPWCYLGKRRLEQALAGFGHRDDVDVVYRSFELDPAAPTDATVPTVQMLAGKYGMTLEQAEAAQRQMEERAAADGLTFHMENLRSGNTRDAHRLVQLAKANGREAELVEALHRAYFTEQESVFDHVSLARIAVDAGLDPAEVDKVLTTDQFADEVTADEATASSLGATGVPFFVIDRRYGISGAQPADTIARALEHAWDVADA
jgi:predicted DsbA family dithiol-disulfide isomerase